MTIGVGLSAGVVGMVLLVSKLFDGITDLIAGFIMDKTHTKWGNQLGGWTKIALVLGIPSCVVGLIRFLYIKEERDVENEKENPISVKESLKCLAQNKYIFILAGAMLLSMVATNVVTSSQTYYFTYIVGDLAQMSVIGILGLAAPFVLLLFPVALRKIGGMNFVKIGAVMAIIGSVLKYFAGANMTLMILGSLLAGAGTSVITMIGSIFVIQCMDYGEWKTGIRVEGILNSITGFATKVGSGLASGIVGLIMGILCVIMFILCCFYDLEKKEGKIREDLEKRHAQK